MISKDFNRYLLGVCAWSTETTRKLISNIYRRGFWVGEDSVLCHCQGQKPEPRGGCYKEEVILRKVRTTQGWTCRNQVVFSKSKELTIAVNIERLVNDILMKDDMDRVPAFEDTLRQRTFRSLPFYMSPCDVDVESQNHTRVHQGNTGHTSTKQKPIPASITP